MKNKKNIEKALLSNIEVSDSVLNKARLEMENQKNKENIKVSAISFSNKASEQGEAITRKLPAKTLVIVAIIIAVSVALLITVIFYPSTNLDNGKTYVFNQLSFREITSIPEYNKERAVSLFYIDTKESDNRCYYDDECDVLILQGFTYRDVVGELYVIMDSKNTIDLLYDYDGFEKSIEILQHTIYYEEDEDGMRAMFQHENRKYCLQIFSNDSELFIAILKHILSV